jgi:pilus assembly protein CpaC
MTFSAKTANMNRKKLNWLRLLMCTAAALPAYLAMDHGAAQASDMDSGQAAQEDGHFIRMGLKKSVVIKLPAEAHDVIVGDPTVVDAVVRTKNTAYLFARQFGQTNIFFFDKEGQQILAVDIEVTGDLVGLRKLLDRSLPGNRIKVDSINNKIVLSGIAANKLEAEKALVIAGAFNSVGTRMPNNSFGHSNDGSEIINAMTIAGEDQVMLKVRVVEVQRNVLKQFGVNMQAMFRLGDAAFNLTSSTPVAAASGINSLFTKGSTSIQGIIRAMENDGLVKTLAEPNLTAVSGQPANFRAGGEVPILTCVGTTAATRTCSTEYRNYGVSLGFTPDVQSDGRISLKINTEVSDIGASNADGNPSFDTRSAQTTVELPSGGSMMLAGLIKDTTRQSIDGLPGLRKLPVLGALFRSRDFVQNQTELVVIVTPYLVGSADARQLATPADNLEVATDRQTILLGRLNKIYGVKGKNPDGVYHGNVGFIVE